MKGMLGEGFKGLRIERHWLVADCVPGDTVERFGGRGDVVDVHLVAGLESSLWDCG